MPAFFMRALFIGARLSRVLVMSALVTAELFLKSHFVGALSPRYSLNSYDENS